MSQRRSLLTVTIVAIALRTVGAPTLVEAAAAAKTVVKCQATLEKTGAKFVAKKLAALAKCSDGVFKCLQTVDEATDAGAKRTACIEKARAGCLKSLTAITAARQAFVAAISGACATLDAAQVTGADGLGYAAATCDTPVTDVASLAACLAVQHDCLASQLFQRMEPRTLELLQFTPPAAVVPSSADLASLECLDDHGGTGADVDDLVLGKAIVKCQSAIRKVGTKIESARAKGVAKCVDALFTCTATKTGDDLQKCRDKARAGCDKTFAAFASQEAALGDSLEKPCGDAALFAALRTPAGANFDALLPAALGRVVLPPACNVIQTSADLYACVHAIILEIIAELNRVQAPRTEGLLGGVGCGLDGCGGIPTPIPTPTPGGGGGGPIAQIIDFNGDGLGVGHHLSYPRFIATDGNGTAYVSGYSSNNVFKIAPNGAITLLMKHTDQQPLLSAFYMAVDGDTVYVVGDGVANVYKIVGGGTPTRLIEATGDGTHELSYGGPLAVDGQHNVYVGGKFSNNVFKITPTGTITQIIDATGDGNGHVLTWPSNIVTDDAGNVYVSAQSSHNAFKIQPNGTITQIIGPTGDGVPGHTLNVPLGLAVQHDTGTVYVAGFMSDNIFRITSNGTVTQFVGPNGDGSGNTFGRPYFMATDAAGTLYATSTGSRVYKITSSGVMKVILNATGDGTHGFGTGIGLAADAAGNVWVTGGDSNNAFEVPAGAQ